MVTSKSEHSHHRAQLLLFAHIYQRPVHVWFTTILKSPQLWSSLSQDKELKHVCENASESLKTPTSSPHWDSSENRQRTNSSRRNMWGFPHCYSLGLGIHSCTWENLYPPPHHSSAFNNFLPTLAKTAWDFVYPSLFIYYPKDRT